MSLSRSIFRLLLGRRPAMVDGTLEVRGLRRPVLVRRDGYGIPYVEAADDEDAWYGLGFCQGQDRAFQLEGLLRVIRGTLSELIGARGLQVDRLSRRIGFHRSAREQLAELDPEVGSTLQAFAMGVSEGATLGSPRPAHELALLRSRPTPWEPADVLGMLKLQSFVLASNWDVELARLLMLRLDGPQAMAALDPVYPPWLPVTAPVGVPAGPAADRLAEDLAAFTSVIGAGGGSNNWAIRASRTSTGRPLLANDPHLAPMLPPHWYLAQVRTPEWAVAGACFVGASGFPVGHNGVAAWGLTAGQVDNTDLFLEELGPDGGSVREADRFVPATVRRETIRVRRGRPVEEAVLETSRGPVIGPALDGEVGAISIRATWLNSLPVSGLLVIHRVQDWKEFRAAFRDWPGIPLNMVYADVSGRVGWQLVGETPRRRKGWGTLPLPGWDPEVGWEEEPVPFEEMPHLADPPDGFVATANNLPQVDGPFLGVDWVDGYRLARIHEELAGRRDWDMPATMALQMDQMSLPWREMRESVLGCPAEGGEARMALDLLGEWDGVVSGDSAAASVFELFCAEMVRRVVEAKAPQSARWGLGEGFSPLVPHSLLSLRRMGHLMGLLNDRPEGWFDRGWEAEMGAALAAAVVFLRERHAPDPGGWAWGAVRPLTLRHPFGDRLPSVFNRRLPWGGDANTVGQASPNLRQPTGDPLFVTSMRMVIDVGNWEAARFVLPGGQSGNPLSPHYDDQLTHWRAGKGVPVAWAPEQIELVTRHTLQLVPGGPT